MNEEFGDPNSFFCMWISTCSSTVVGKKNLSPLDGLDTLTIDIWIYYWTINSIALIYKSLLMPVPQGLDYCSFWNWEVWVLQLHYFSRLFWLDNISFNINFFSFQVLSAQLFIILFSLLLCIKIFVLIKRVTAEYVWWINYLNELINVNHLEEYVAPSILLAVVVILLSEILKSHL